MFELKARSNMRSANSPEPLVKQQQPDPGAQEIALSIRPGARPFVFCCGGSAVDRKYSATKPITLGTKNQVKGYRAFGGVARNVAENLVRLGVETSLMTIVGNDEDGRALVGQLDDLGVDTSQIVVTDRTTTAEYAAVLGPDGDLVVGLSDVGIFDLLDVGHLERAWPHLATAAWVFAECNLPAEILGALVERKSTAQFRLAVDAVSKQKAERLPHDLSGIDILFLNAAEAAAYFDHSGRAAAASIEAAASSLMKAGAGAVVLTDGANGLIVGCEGRTTRHPAVPAKTVDVVGAGDAMIAGTLFRLIGGAPLAESARTGALLAAMTTETDTSVVPNLTPGLLTAMAARAHFEPTEVTA